MKLPTGVFIKNRKLWVKLKIDGKWKNVPSPYRVEEDPEGTGAAIFRAQRQEGIVGNCPRNRDPLDRFLSCIEPEPNSGCWLWTGAVTLTGYGRCCYHARTGLAHRFSYETFVGPIPEGTEIDHKCMVRCCVNPGHLHVVTHAENLSRTGPWVCLRSGAEIDPE